MELSDTDVTIQERLRRLESQNKRIKRLGLLSLVCVLGVLLMGQAKNTQEIEAKKLVIRYPNGDPAITLSADEDVAKVLLAQRDGKAGMGLRTSASGTTIALFDAAGVLSLMSSGTKAPSLQLHDKDGEPKAVLSLSGEGGSLGLWSHRSKEPVISLLTIDGPTIDLEDEQGYSAALGRANLRMPQTGEAHRTSAASLVLLGKDKKVIWKAP